MLARTRLTSRRTAAPPVVSIPEAVDPRVEWRAERLTGIQSAREALKFSETALVEKAAPLEKRMAELRSELEGLEVQLAPLAAERISAMNRCDAAIAELRNELRNEAREVQTFQRAIELSRTEVLTNIYGRRAAVLGTAGTHTQAHIEGASNALFAAYYEAQHAATAEADVPSALARIHERLLESGIKLVE